MCYNGKGPNFKAMLRCFSLHTPTMHCMCVCVCVCMCVCGTILVEGAYNLKAMLRFCFVKTDIYISHHVRGVCVSVCVCVCVLAQYEWEGPKTSKQC